MERKDEAQLAQFLTEIHDARLKELSIIRRFSECTHLNLGFDASIELILNVLVDELKLSYAALFKKDCGKTVNLASRFPLMPEDCVLVASTGTMEFSFAHGIAEQCIKHGQSRVISGLRSTDVGSVFLATIPITIGCLPAYALQLSYSENTLAHGVNSLEVYCSVIASILEARKTHEDDEISHLAPAQTVLPMKPRNSLEVQEQSSSLSRILLVDDNEQALQAISTMLKDENYSVETIADGAEAERLARSGDYNLVITDLEMDGADGFDVAAATKRANEETAVILITGAASDLDSAYLRERHVDYFLSKPFTFNKISGLVSEVLGPKR